MPPAATIWPGGKRANQDQDQEDEQDRAKHDDTGTWLMFRLPTFCVNNQFPVRSEVIRDATLLPEYTVSRTTLVAAGGSQTTPGTGNSGVRFNRPRLPSVTLGVSDGF